MTIDIKVSGKRSEIDPSTIQAIRRAINFLCNDNITATLEFKAEEGEKPHKDTYESIKYLY